MRLWSLHPRYLDTVGLVALWRETLLALAILQGKTKGYKHHPQLTRFKTQDNPLEALTCYAIHVAEEMKRRGYKPDTTKLPSCSMPLSRQILTVTAGQLSYEQQHLYEKMWTRKKFPGDDVVLRLCGPGIPGCNPVFCAVEGEVEDWERGEKHGT